MFEPCPGPRGSLNWIGARILEKKLAKITPENWIEDQYFVCILLALAQVQEHKMEGPKPASYIVGLPGLPNSLLGFPVLNCPSVSSYGKPCHGRRMYAFL